LEIIRNALQSIITLIELLQNIWNAKWNII